MEKSTIFKKEKIGESGYLNRACWLVKSLNYGPYKRCQYCELRFHHCPFLQYQIISLALIVSLFTAAFFVEGRVSEVFIVSTFILVIVYGYFFNKSTDRVVQAYFTQRKARDALEELAKTLESQVKDRTKELKKAYEEVDKLSRAKSEFISIASHQLRTPLTAIKGYISMILEGSYGKLSEKCKVPIGNIFKSNERLITLVNSLLDISRIESGKMEFKPEWVTMEEAIEGVLNELRIAAEKKNIYLKWGKCTPSLPKLFLDKEKIRQVILNLIDNAIKYTQKGGITIRCQISDDKFRIIISDTGGGMTKEEMGKIFESFSRGTVGTAKYTEGAGLGLYIAKKFVEMHSGRIWAESEGKDKGSAFFIELPLSQKRV